jgi:hypothetical protein
MSLEGFSKEYRYRLALEKIAQQLPTDRCEYPNSCCGDCTGCLCAYAVRIAEEALGKP